MLFNPAKFRDTMEIVSPIAKRAADFLKKIHLIVDADSVVMRSTDNDVWCTATMDSQNSETFEAIVDASHLVNAIRCIRMDDEGTIELVKNKLIITGTSGKIGIPTFTATDFASPPVVNDGIGFKVNNKTLADCMYRMGVAVGTGVDQSSSTRQPVIMVACGKDNVRLLNANTSRITVVGMEATIPTASANKYLGAIPKSVSSCLTGSWVNEGEMEFLFGANVFSVLGSHCHMVGRLSEANPNVAKKIMAIEDWFNVANIDMLQFAPIIQSMSLASSAIESGETVLVCLDFDVEGCSLFMSLVRSYTDFERSIKCRFDSQTSEARHKIYFPLQTMLDLTKIISGVSRWKIHREGKFIRIESGKTTQIVSANSPPCVSV